MRRICAWCGRDLGRVETSLYPDSIVSHGICSTCAQKYFNSPKRPAGGFFMRFKHPLHHLVRT
ncbi:MAG TPA: hypothetical protein PKM41_14850 [Deltaproteobacteria bacterium]|nr:hypothetical protein [Deltaproteobacteria bacterium]HOI08384.1 hypothetical protein [Deltaproteobacteria bacterium]